MSSGIIGIVSSDERLNRENSTNSGVQPTKSIQGNESKSASQNDVNKQADGLVQLTSQVPSVVFAQ